MDLSGVIFVVVALAWAGFLIPKLLRHHDEVARTRAVDRFSSATRVLARREPVDGASARLVVTQRTQTRLDTSTATPPAATTATRRAARAAARRRRRILGLLVLALAGVGIAAAVAALPLWAVAVPAGATVLYLGLCRVLVRRERRPLRQSTTVETVETVTVAGPDPAPQAEERNPQGFAEVSAQEDTVTLSSEDLEAASLWDPLPITLPTYVGKPKARRTVRTIDLTAQDVSSSGRAAADSELVAGTTPPEEQTSEPARAVGS